MNRTAMAMALTAATLFAWAPAPAHHAFTMFDQEKELVLSGTVRELQWTNPHVWLQLIVEDASGKATEWSLECLSINRLARMGWKRGSVAPGEKVTVTVFPLKAGGAGGALKALKLADGTVLPGVGE